MCNHEFRSARRRVGQPLARLARLALAPFVFFALLLGIAGLGLLLTAGTGKHIDIAHLDLVGVAQALAVVAATGFVGALANRLRVDRLRRLTELATAAAALQAQATQLGRAVQRYAATAQRLAAAVLRSAPPADPQAAVSGLATVCLTPRLVGQRPFAARVQRGPAVLT
ncbi:MAG: hypothetical protein KGJ54_03750 [Betaproteobacteria bacterium]|jgi:hypothetical protein|nr:hypothetical protein [Betaproteobacteria bacterium]